MTKPSPDLKPGILADIIEQARKSLPRDAEALAGFIAFYYRGTAAADLAGAQPSDLLGAAVSHRKLALAHTAGTPASVRVYNPRIEDHGWQSTHTIVEIVADDAPFLVDSARMAINRCGHAIHLTIHPGVLASADDTLGATCIHFQIDRLSDAQRLLQVRDQVSRALHDVQAAVADFEPMRERVTALLDGLQSPPTLADPEETVDARAFLTWLRDGHFIFLAYREHDLRPLEDGLGLFVVPGSALGLLRGTDEAGGDPATSSSFTSLSREAQALALAPVHLVLTRSGSQSTVHRPGFLDFVGIKKFDEDGRVVGEHRFLGLYTSNAYTGDVQTIPVLRRKVANVLARSGYQPRSHSRRALLNILQQFPRDELIQSDVDELLETTLGILQLQDRQRTKAFVRRDPYGRFYSCLVFIPRDHMNTDVRRRIGELLEQATNGQCVSFTVQIAESALARIHYLIHIERDQSTEPDLALLQEQIATASRPWQAHFQSALVHELGEERAARLYARLADGFRADYRELYPPQLAVADAVRIDGLTDADPVAMTLYRPLETPEGQVRFKLYHLGRPVPPSEALPMLENMGLRVLDEHPSRVSVADGQPVWIHDFGLEHQAGALDLAQVREIFEQAFGLIFRGRLSNDGFNRLVLGAGLDWRKVGILRAYSRYLRQIRATFSLSYVEQTLAANAELARLLIELFEARFDPALPGDRQAAEQAVNARIDVLLENVSNLDDDRILRGLRDTLLATLRTNYYRRDAGGQARDYLSLKLASAQVPNMPEPHPMAEIFVYSPRVEGVHLRSGPVARGGLLVRDRPEDFRTEVLGLLKAQMVKNAVIVPVGSKGGFVPQQLPVGGSRQQLLDEAIACYRIFISGLLDLTDNIVAGQVVPPAQTVRHDGDDPYLVVAADKGTATFSDIANEVSLTYGSWIGDAFASGGSSGYDHKRMAITARGAWESVKRHFREIGLDVQQEKFTAIGIGDMSGDVFGNGMLLSPTMALVGAFNHQHIFLDPDPDVARALAERQRLFTLPGSSWSDYDPALLSPGGGIYSRQAKSIPLTAQVRERLQITATRLSPSDLVRAMLSAPVDLLWNGGIGTYVKAAIERHDEVGDRANDALRIDAGQLRCRVIGEGGNLGLTQRARIAYARQGGHLYTDAIDNAGGVDCSDHEVNIKILLNHLVAEGELTLRHRNELLVEMTDDVARLVLRNNTAQTLALSLAQVQARDMMGVHGRLIQALEASGKLDRQIEFLPSDKEISQRKADGEGLSAPELAVLMAYVKIDLCERLSESGLADDPWFDQVLAAYFPARLRESFPQRLSGHQLRREIIVTETVNGMVNRAGISFVHRLLEETGAQVADVVSGYLVANEVLGLAGLWEQIEALDNRVTAKVQYEMMLDVRKLLERTTRWLLRHRPRPLLVGPSIDRYRQPLLEITDLLGDNIGEQQAQAGARLADQRTGEGVPAGLAAAVSMFNALSVSLGLAEISLATNTALARVIHTHFDIGSWAWTRCARRSPHPRDSRWDMAAAQRNELLDIHLQPRRSCSVPVTPAPRPTRGWRAPRLARPLLRR
ncbi:MAG: NAD-glutamate dehydrogenase [Burkholderiaceae bacterium]